MQVHQMRLMKRNIDLLRLTEAQHFNVNTHYVSLTTVFRSVHVCPIQPTAHVLYMYMYLHV